MTKAECINGIMRKLKEIALIYGEYPEHRDFLSMSFVQDSEDKGGNIARIGCYNNGTGLENIDTHCYINLDNGEEVG